MFRDVTDHLQLLLRKSGHHLHTSAEREVVRTIKEKTCYVALNPVKEEKENGGAWEEFRLPDGKVLQVSHIATLPVLTIAARRREILGT
jgi:centractin